MPGALHEDPTWRPAWIFLRLRSGWPSVGVTHPVEDIVYPGVGKVLRRIPFGLASHGGTGDGLSLTVL